jgi:hypothetical protein
VKGFLIVLTAAFIGLAVGVALSLAVFFVSEAAFVAEPATVLQEPGRSEPGRSPDRNRNATPTSSPTPDDDHGGRGDDDDHGEDDDSDNSGKGSDDDSSGKGSGGSDDDSSGKGSGGSDDDSSGSGSDDDSSGKGSDGD